MHSSTSFVWELQHAVRGRPELADVPEFRAILAGDADAMTGFGVERVAMALVSLFEGIEPEVFEQRVRTFFADARHSDNGRPYDQLIYQPMLELLEALTARGFTNCIVTGGGTEFVRAVSHQIYGIAQERVVGTLVTYDIVDRGGRPTFAPKQSSPGRGERGRRKDRQHPGGLGSPSHIGCRKLSRRRGHA